MITSRQVRFCSKYSAVALSGAKKIAMTLTPFFADKLISVYSSESRKNARKVMQKVTFTQFWKQKHCRHKLISKRERSHIFGVI